MARLLQALRTLDGDEKKTFPDFMNTKLFDMILAASLQCCMPYFDDIEDLRAPSNAFKIRYDLKRMLNAYWALLVKDDPKSEQASEIQTLVKLVNLE